MFDAMPAYWKNMIIEQRQKIIQQIDQMSKETADIWTDKTHLLKLTELVEFKQLNTIRICHQVVKQYPGCMVGLAPPQKKENPEPTEDAKNKPTKTLDPFLLLPPKLLKNAKHTSLVAAERKKEQMKLFEHIVRFRNREQYSVKELKVSTHLDVEVTADQQRLLNPSVLDTITGFIIKDSQGEGAKKRLPQRRLNMIDGLVSSHCCVLNSAERLDLIKKSNQIAALMAEIEVDRSKQKEEARKRKEEAQKEKDERRQNRLQKKK